MSSHPEPSGNALHRECDWLGSERQHSQRSVLRHPHKPRKGPYPVCVSRRGNVRPRCVLLFHINNTVFTLWIPEPNGALQIPSTLWKLHDARGIRLAYVFMYKLQRTALWHLILHGDDCWFAEMLRKSNYYSQAYRKPCESTEEWAEKLAMYWLLNHVYFNDDERQEGAWRYSSSRHIWRTSSQRTVNERLQNIHDKQQKIAST